MTVSYISVLLLVAGIRVGLNLHDWRIRRKTSFNMALERSKKTCVIMAWVTENINTIYQEYLNTAYCGRSKLH